MCIRDRPVHWSCDGGTEYDIQEGNKNTIGTEITLFLNEDCLEFACLLYTSLKEHGMKLAVCSNKPHPAAVKVIAQLFDGEFDMVVDVYKRQE